MIHCAKNKGVLIQSGLLEFYRIGYCLQIKEGIYLCQCNGVNHTFVNIGGSTNCNTDDGDEGIKPNATLNPIVQFYKWIEDKK